MQVWEDEWAAGMEVQRQAESENGVGARVGELEACLCGNRWTEVQMA